MAVRTGGNAWQVSLERPSHPRRSGEVPCVARNHLGSSLRRAHAVNGTMTQLHVPARVWSPEPLLPPKLLLGAGWDGA